VQLVGHNRRVIDVGCGPGVVASRLAQRGCEITVVDADPEALSLASGHARRAYCLDLNDPAWTEHIERGYRYDVVVLSDVLEHLVDPDAALRSAVQLLAEGGHVVLSLPNISHNGIIATLWKGNFKYSETGLLDRTHVRFFSAKDIEPLLERASLILEHVEFVTVHPRRTEFASAWEALPLHTKLSLRSNPYGNIYQFVLRARPAAFASSPITIDSVPIPRVRDPLWMMPLRPLVRLARRHQLIA
jgi:SAM-dependent methyltransferase